MDVENIKVRSKEDELFSEEDLGINKGKAAGRLKKNSKGEMVIEVREEELLNEPV